MVVVAVAALMVSKQVFPDVQSLWWVLKSSQILSISLQRDWMASIMSLVPFSMLSKMSIFKEGI